MADPREFRFEFPCPKCQGKLRLRDRALIGTRWNCPECHAPLEIRDTGNGGLAATLVATASPTVTAAPPGIRLRTAAALVMVVLITGVAVLVLRAPEPVVPPPQKIAEPAVEHPSAENAASPVVPEAAPKEVPISAETQLTAIGKWLNQQHDKHGAFPVGVESGPLPMEERFGWLARLEDETNHSATASPDRSRGWKDPANDAFVRHRAPGLLNPAVTAIASEDGYPAGHYVGIAGVGKDAPELDKGHPRAGIFGWERRTTRDDVKDGTSNTLMVAGVDSHPAAWASGVGSIRGLSAEPYVHGPDHLGTGQADGMFVLLADGSVKFMAANTDPKVLRRMAAMADGLPLDPAVPGEPSDPVVTAPAAPMANPAAPSNSDSPITVELTPERAGYDFEKNLGVKLSQFKTPKPIPLRGLLRQLTEMSAMPIDLSDISDPAVLDQAVTVDLKQTTIRGVLEECLKQAGLTFSVSGQGIKIIRTP